MVEDPRWQLGLSAARVKLDLAPVGVLQEFGVGETEFLGARCAYEAGSKCVSLICPEMV